VFRIFQDAQLLTDIRRVQKETEERAVVLQKIASDMEDDLDELTNFTENVNSRRPKGKPRLLNLKKLKFISTQYLQLAPVVITIPHRIVFKASNQFFYYTRLSYRIV